MLAEKIGKYELVQRLASGSMGTVYSAHDPFTKRLAAIKVAHPQYAEDTANARKFRKLFFNEAHAAGMKVNDSTVDRAAEATQLRFHKAFVRTLIERLSDVTTLFSQLRRA